MLYKGTAPVFITTKQQFLEGLIAEARRAELAGSACEASMLLRRLVMYNFAVKLPIPDGLHIPDCACCFAKVVIQHSVAHRGTGS